jgi:hypothetical protein
VPSRGPRRGTTSAPGSARIGRGFLDGPPQAWVEQLTDLALNHGMSAFFLYRADNAVFIRRFAAEVVPAMRERVATPDWSQIRRAFQISSTGHCRDQPAGA